MSIDILSVLQDNSEVTSLVLDKNLNLEELQALSQLSFVEKIDIEGDFSPNPDLFFILKTLPKLKHLTLCSNQMRGIAWAQIPLLSTLESLSLYQGQEISEDFFINLNSLLNLKELSLLGSYPGNPNILQKALESLPNLERLHFDIPDIPHTYLAKLSLKKTLAHLSINRIQYTRHKPLFVSGFSNLKSLSLSNVEAGSEAFAFLKESPVLESLSLNRVEYDSGFTELSFSNPKLKSIDLSGNLLNEEVLLENDFQLFLPNLESFRTLDFVLSDKHLLALLNSTQLEIIRTKGSFTEKSLSKLSNCERLKSFELTFVTPTLFDPNFLSENKEIEVVSISNGIFDTSKIQLLCGLDKLKRLNLKGCKLNGKPNSILTIPNLKHLILPKGAWQKNEWVSFWDKFQGKVFWL